MSTLQIVQCWDDGVSTDIRLTDILRKYNAKASFNLNAGKYDDTRGFGWKFKETEVFKLCWKEMKSVYDGFTIANHTLNHPHLENLTPDEVKNEISGGRQRLQDFFGEPILGFAYPFGTYNDTVLEILEECGHLYGRTVKNVSHSFPPDNPMTFHPNCHFLAEDFYECYENAKSGEVFYFWGHSYEMISDAMWNDFEKKIKFITEDPDSKWAELPELFTPVS